MKAGLSESSFFRLVINDTEDTKRKKLYLCPKCGKYYFISDEA